MPEAGSPGAVTPRKTLSGHRHLPRYLLASAIALVCDSALLLWLVHGAGLHAGPAGAIAYGVGVLVHYRLSRAFVFPAGWLNRRRALELAGFVATGLLGMALTVVILEAGTRWLSLPVALSKAVAVGASFLLTYLLRGRLVFRS